MEAFSGRERGRIKHLGPRNSGQYATVRMRRGEASGTEEKQISGSRFEQVALILQQHIETMMFFAYVPERLRVLHRKRLDGSALPRLVIQQQKCGRTRQGP